MGRIFPAVRAVARTTLLEGLQQPVTLLLCLCCFEAIALQPVLQLHTFGEPGRLTRDCGMAFMLIFGLLVAAATAAFSLSGEIKDGTAAASMAKPVGRGAFICGKFLGACLILAAFCWCGAWTVALACRTAEAMVSSAHTYRPMRDVACGAVSVLLPLSCLGMAALLSVLTRRRMALWFFLFLSVLLPVSAAVLGLWGRDGWWVGFSEWTPQLDLRLISPAMLVFFLLCILAALETALATRLQAGAALAVSFLALFLGFLSDSLGASFWGAILAAVVPAVPRFWVVDWLSGGGSVPPGYLAFAALHAFFFAAFYLSLGVISFKWRDL